MKGSTADYQAENRISELEERSFKTIKSEEQKGKRTKQKKNKKRAHEGPSFCRRGRSSRGQADQLPGSAPHSQHMPTLLPGCPWGRSAPHQGWRRRSPRGDLGGCQLNLLLPRWKQSQRRQQERMNLQIQKGRSEQRENRWKWPPKRLKIYLHQMERLKTRIA